MTAFSKTYTTKFLLLIIAILGITSWFLTSKPAQASILSLSDREKLISESNCPETIKSKFKIASNEKATILPSDRSGFEAQGVKFIVDTKTNQVVSIQCATVGDLERIIMRIMVFLVSIIGLVVAYSIAKSAVMLISAFADEEKVKAATKSLQTGILSVIAVFFSYILVVFIIVGVLGVGTEKNREWNIICQHRIVFQLTFQDTNDTGELETETIPDPLDSSKTITVAKPRETCK